MNVRVRGDSEEAYLVWEKRAVLMCAFGFVGIGALVGAGQVYVNYIGHRVEHHLSIQSLAGSKANSAYSKSSLKRSNRSNVSQTVTPVDIGGGINNEVPTKILSLTLKGKRVRIPSPTKISSSTIQDLPRAVLEPGSVTASVASTTFKYIDDSAASASSSSKPPIQQNKHKSSSSKLSANRKASLKKINPTPKQVTLTEHKRSRGSLQKSVNSFLPSNIALDPRTSLAVNDAEVQFNQFCANIDELLEGSASNKHEAYVILTKNNQKLGERCDFLWRFARATHIESIEAAQQQDVEAQKTLLVDAVSYAEKAMKINDNSGDAHKWYAITLGNQSNFMKVNERIKIGYTFKEHIERALILNPQDSFLHYLLGRFCFEVSQLTWVERKMAAALFSNPPSSTVPEALAHFLKSETLGKPSIENHLFITKCYIAMSDYKKAASYLHVGSLLTPNNFDEKKAHKEITELLPKYRKYL